MKLRHRHHCVFLLLLGSVLNGCSAGPTRSWPTVECTPPAPATLVSGPALVGREYGMQISPIPLNAVLYTDSGVARASAVQQISSHNTDTGTVEVLARFINCSDEPLNLGVRTSFLDQHQAPFEKPSAWQSVFLRARATGVYRELSISPNAPYFLIEVSNANK